jgi:hypothetical protein
MSVRQVAKVISEIFEIVDSQRGVWSQPKLAETFLQLVREQHLDCLGILGMLTK